MLLAALGTAGCASGLPHGQQTDYSDLPGTSDSAKGPGLLSGGHYDKSNGGGTLLYSDDHPEKSVFGSARHRSEQAAAGENAQAPAAATPTKTGSPSEFEDFRKFEAYKHFQQLPSDSPEKKRFKDWQEWQEYKQWQRQR